MKVTVRWQENSNHKVLQVFFVEIEEVAASTAAAAAAAAFSLGDGICMRITASEEKRRALFRDDKSA